MLAKTIPTAILILSLFLQSCQSESNKKWEETMKVHDEVMLKMQETGDTEIKLDQLITLASAADSTTLLHSKVDTLEHAYFLLEKADEAMMDWMAAIQKPRIGDDQDSILNYLNQEQQAIIEVGIQMDNAITHAELIIESLEK